MSIKTDYYDKKIRKSLGLILLMFIASLVVLTGAYCGLIKPDTEPTSIWFQRAGSLVTLMAIACDLFLYRSPQGFADLGEINSLKNNGSLIILSRVIVVIMPVIGTLVWGYGDLIYLGIN
ncbi:hypothetical protein MHM89_01205 [Pseudoalteromonas sp. CNC9-20]|uniref:hypothetical protein n=1 Tax=Pseudoalteromonas sp. CNC9-20 TaxID=2917750 RepID=UPI001EF5B344|nr:hypothetical protein [Pseudoalteromonas sp. CNC9-20]MCG7568533.1 hypothetical protein [Pseudoalteromonas sp. CNC9-20]